MTLIVILEGHKGSGKTHIGKLLKNVFEEKEYVTSFFDEEGIIKECLNNDVISVYDIYGLREQEYWSLFASNDIIFIEKSFITNLIYHLPNAPENVVTDFIKYELGHYYSDDTSCQIYTLFRDYGDKNVDYFLGLSHHLLETYNVDITCLPNSQDDKTNDLIKHISERIEWELD